MQSYPQDPKALKLGLLEFIGSQSFTHCLTLNSDRQLSAKRMEEIFGTFCLHVDRATHLRGRVKNLPSCDRFNAIAFPEHLETNAHLHALVDLASLQKRYADLRDLHNVVRICWLKSTRGAGSIQLDVRRSDGFDGYAAKAAYGLNPRYFLARDSHPN